MFEWAGHSVGMPHANEETKHAAGEICSLDFDQSAVAEELRQATERLLAAIALLNAPLTHADDIYILLPLCLRGDALLAQDPFVSEQHRSIITHTATVAHVL